MKVADLTIDNSMSPDVLNLLPLDTFHFILCNYVQYYIDFPVLSDYQAIDLNSPALFATKSGVLLDL